jgi:hypothetical protein
MRGASCGRYPRHSSCVVGVAECVGGAVNYPPLPPPPPFYSLQVSLVRALMDSAATAAMSGESVSQISSTAGGVGSLGDGGDDELDERGAWHPASPTHPARLASRRAVVQYTSALRVVPPTPSSKSSSADGGGAGDASFLSPVPKSAAASAFTARDAPLLPAPLGSVRTLRDAQMAAEKAFFAALPAVHAKGVRKGLAPLIEKGFVHPSPEGVAHFLSLAGWELASDREIGDYLGDEGRGPEEAA